MWKVIYKSFYNVIPTMKKYYIMIKDMAKYIFVELEVWVSWGMLFIFWKCTFHFLLVSQYLLFHWAPLGTKGAEAYKVLSTVPDTHSFSWHVKYHCHSMNQFVMCYNASSSIFLNAIEKECTFVVYLFLFSFRIIWKRWNVVVTLTACWLRRPKNTETC